MQFFLPFFGVAVSGFITECQPEAVRIEGAVRAGVDLFAETLEFRQHCFISFRGVQITDPMVVGEVFAFTQMAVGKDEDVGVAVCHAAMQFQFVRQFVVDGDIPVPQFFLQPHACFEQIPALGIRMRYGRLGYVKEGMAIHGEELVPSMLCNEDVGEFEEVVGIVPVDVEPDVHPDARLQQTRDIF